VNKRNEEGKFLPALSFQNLSTKKTTTESRRKTRKGGKTIGGWFVGGREMVGETANLLRS